MNKKAMLVIFLPEAGGAAAAVYAAVKQAESHVDKVKEVPIVDSADYQHLVTTAEISCVAAYLAKHFRLVENRHYYFAHCSVNSPAGMGMSC